MADPDDEVGQGRARHVPLSAKVLEILSAMPRWADCPYVVPSPLVGKEDAAEEGREKAA